MNTEIKKHFDFKYTPASVVSNSGISELDHPVLGSFTGIFAKLDEYSENNRYYSEKFWEDVLKRVSLKKALDDGLLFGNFEHPSIPNIYTTDKSKNNIAAGLPTYSHPIYAAFVTKELWIEGKNLMGRAYVLNSTVGRLLASIMLAKDRHGDPLVKMWISARGFSKKDYFDSHGVDIMNSDDYELFAFDATLDPGVLGTRIKFESRGKSNSNFMGDSNIIEKTRSSLLIQTTDIKQNLISELNLTNT